jgi:DNA-binding transcriptional LysR family regulator
VVLTAAHPFARLKSVALEKVAAEPLISLRRQDYREYLNRIFAPTGVKPRIAVQCDTFGSLLIEVEAGHGIALGIPIFKLAGAKRLLFRPITGTTEGLSVGIARATKGDLTPAGEQFCEILRNMSNGANGKTKLVSCPINSMAFAVGQLAVFLAESLPSTPWTDQYYIPLTIHAFSA